MSFVQNNQLAAVHQIEEAGKRNEFSIDLKRMIVSEIQLSKLQRAAAIGTAKIMQKHINSGS